MNLQERETERIVAHVAPGMAPYIAHDLYRRFCDRGVLVRYTETTVEVEGDYIAVAIEAWLQACQHVTSLDRHDVHEVVVDDEQLV